MVFFLFKVVYDAAASGMVPVPVPSGTGSMVPPGGRYHTNYWYRYLLVF